VTQIARQFDTLANLQQADGSVISPQRNWPLASSKHRVIPWPSLTKTIEGRWHKEVSPGSDRPQTDVEG
jgi:hypothetical protein